jgi:hypothetical protein
MERCHEWSSNYLMVLLDLFDGIKVWDDGQLPNLFRDHASIDARIQKLL